jgi:hypothetical protein
MAWVKSDDRTDDTRKVKRAWKQDRATIGLWYMAKTCSARHESDGLVPLEWVEDKLPDEEERERVLCAMCERDLFERLPAGETRTLRIRDMRVKYGPLDEDAFIVHDYLEFNEARQEAEERRSKEAKRKADAREQARLAALAKTAAGVPGSSEECPPGQPLDKAGSPANV